MSTVRPMFPESTIEGLVLFETLTNRQREIFFMVCRDMLSNKAIGEKLGISSKTVETHRHAINLKLGVHNPLQLMRFAMSSGLV